MTEPTLFGLTIIPAIVGLVQVAKDIGLPSRIAPAAAVVLGVLFGLAQLYATTETWIPAASLGIAFGLSACGLYDTARTLIPALTGDGSPSPETTTHTPPTPVSAP
jgi:hypothetical protein